MPAGNDRPGPGPGHPDHPARRTDSFLDLPNRYELCTLLRRLAHDHRKCILFSTHELDIALSLCDSIALIDPPVLRYLPTPDMACSGYIERLFSNSFVTFDTESGTIKVRK